jgi:16S rRNA (guanine527-N7)-methyltransferase
LIVRYNNAMLPGQQKQLLEKFVNAVLAAPRFLSLTATDDPAEFWDRHILDALRVVSLLPKTQQESALNVIDVGSGNGVPGIPAAIACPHWHVTLLDSNNKKCGFLDTFCKFNEIKNVTVLAGRAEEFGRDPDYREMFDLSFARALAKLPVALELATPFIRKGGSLCIPHGQSYDSEMFHVKKTMKELGVISQTPIPYSLSRNDKLKALIFEKVSGTPEKYPRKVGIPHKRPLYDK